MLSRASESVKFTKVRGHAGIVDVVAGRSTHVNRYGNHMADLLATAGAAMEAVPKVMLREVRIGEEGMEERLIVFKNEKEHRRKCEHTAATYSKEIPGVATH